MSSRLPNGLFYGGVVSNGARGTVHVFHINLPMANMVSNFLPLFQTWSNEQRLQGRRVVFLFDGMRSRPLSANTVMTILRRRNGGINRTNGRTNVGRGRTSSRTSSTSRARSSTPTSRRSRSSNSGYRTPNASPRSPLVTPSAPRKARLTSSRASPRASSRASPRASSRASPRASPRRSMSSIGRGRRLNFNSAVTPLASGYSTPRRSPRAPLTPGAPTKRRRSNTRR